MEERRRTSRERTYLAGRVVYNSKNSTIDCVVRNLASGGAKIAFSDSVPIPPELEFLVIARREIKRAQIVWRKQSQAGLMFVA